MLKKYGWEGGVGREERMNEWSVEKLSRACSLAGWKSLLGGHVRPLSSWGDLWGCQGLGGGWPCL